MLDVIDLFNEQDTRDEIGIGAIRDAFADRLFPGTCADRDQRSDIRGQIEENSAMSGGRIVDQYVYIWRFGSSNLYRPERTSTESSGRRLGPRSSDCRAASTARVLAPGGSGSFPSRSRATIRPWPASARQLFIPTRTWIRPIRPVSSTGILDCRKNLTVFPRSAPFSCARRTVSTSRTASGNFIPKHCRPSWSIAGNPLKR